MSNRVRRLPRLLSALFAMALAPLAHAFDPFVVRDIRVEGIQRTEAGTVFGYLPVKVGERFTQEQATQAVRALFGTGFSYDSVRRTRQAKVLHGLIDQVRDVRRVGAASLDLCSVAAGRLDLYYERGLHPWDHAAGGLVAAEAGARVGAFGEDREGINLLIAAAPDLYAAAEPILVKLFNEFMADDDI